jgi:glutathione synthase/RimK-type ligase-like ATP-grasp enzyme
MFTELIKKDELSKISNTFFPSLFQEALQKEIEIRTFYLDGKCYSMAIFSQLDHQTMVDFRMYNNENGNRNLPYKLPENLELKIKKLMKSLELNTGSIDIIKTKDGRFVFLEVNPWGQYGMVSDPCNYNLDEKIAKYLVNT